MMKFIGIEGLDGAGKSTQIELLTSHLKQNGIAYEYLHFPRFDAPFFGELVARFLRGEMGGVDSVDPYLVSLMFAGDRRDARPMVEGWLAEGKTVILDRYVYSNIAFQCAKLDGERREQLKRWILDYEFVYNALPRPEATILLDVPFSFTERKLTSQREGADRSYLRGATDIHEESLGLQRRVREVYMELSVTQHDLKVVDCSDTSGGMLPPAAIFEKIKLLIG